MRAAITGEIRPGRRAIRKSVRRVNGAIAVVHTHGSSHHRPDGTSMPSKPSVSAARATWVR